MKRRHLQLLRTLTMTNLSAPIFWQRLVANTTDDAGEFQFSNANAPTFPPRFYRAWSP